MTTELKQLVMRTDERAVMVDGKRVALWRRDAVGALRIDIACEFFDGKSDDDLHIDDAKTLANAILAVIKDAESYD